jgi:hypothetical protein
MFEIARSRDMRSRPKTCATSYQNRELTERELDHLTDAEALLIKPIDFVALRGEIDNRVAGLEPMSAEGGDLRVNR